MKYLIEIAIQITAIITIIIIGKIAVSVDKPREVDFKIFIPCVRGKMYIFYLIKKLIIVKVMI
ncbi:hypothetical protein [Vallitalea guaymasensis]|uniref:Uncharacterized protein n=1 Tax=Vallitalea guaymasensis TaxID=1185412 RepID=A0A8J8SCA6_9FIRM|nr:hypothetical protein [Vallitalea guaymasensis]QUH29633.1 hypothetical protein HYG85_12240 [Vallitalea guaymasensis]